MDIYKVEDREGSAGIGTVEYDPETKTATISLELGSKQAKQVKDYFNTEREFWIPESQEIDDYRIERAKPVENSEYFRQAMSMLYGVTGVYVLWDAPVE
jgi:hypothetical protein